MSKYYAVKVGKKPGIYQTWSKCKEQVDGYSRSEYKSFSTEAEALAYLDNKKQDAEITEVKKTKAIALDSLTPGQKKAYDYMISGENVFLTGEAGTGKSYVINAFLEEMDTQEKNVLVCAPTGIAAINVNGVTIHRSFQASLEPQINQRIFKVPETVREADIIIIDEISMCRVDLFDYVVRVIAKAEEECLGRKQLIVVGDFFQLPPVTMKADYEVLSKIYPDYDKGFAFESNNWNDFGFKMVELKNVMRQSDNTFINALNKVRVGNKTGLQYFNQYASSELIDQGIVLCATNKVADKINKEELDKLKSRAKNFKAIVNGDVKESDKPTRDVITLKVGARVIILVNDTAAFKFQNGSLGTIVAIRDGIVEVELDQNHEIVNFGFYEWKIEDYTLVTERIDGVEFKRIKKKQVGSFMQIPLKLAYAITIHKSQGQTYDKVNLIPYSFDCGQLYVALSRVKSIEGLCLVQKIRQEYLICNDKVKAFYHLDEKLTQDQILIDFAKRVLLMKDVHNDCPMEIKRLINKTYRELRKIRE